MRRNMIMLLAAALLVVTGCKKDDKTTEGEKMTFSAGFDNGSAKTEIDGLDMSWNEGDAVMINGKTFTADKSGSTTTLSGEKTYQEGGLYKAYFPASMYDNGTLTLPATQTYNGSNLSGVNPMYAQSATTDLTFSNLCAMVKLTLTGNATVKEIRVTADKPLSGEFEIAESGSNYKAVMKGQTGNAGVVLNCGDGVDLSASDVFYVALPEGTYTNLKFYVVTTDNKGASIEIASATLRANELSELARTPVFKDLVTPSTVTLTAGCSDEFIYNVGGSVTVPEGEHTCEFGLVYSATNAEPTLDNGTKVVAGTATFSGTKTFSADLTGLTASTTYHVRAYAMIEGTAYSTVKDIVGGSTPLPMTWANGKSPKKFSVSATQTVYFSQGNLQYTTTGTHFVAGGGTATGTWRFAEHQFDFIGADNKNVAQTYGGWIDLFGWGTSGYNDKYPYMTSETSTDYGNGDTNISGTNYDWGVYNAISNGGGSSWRTLTNDEMVYLISTRKDGSGNLLYGEGKVGSCTPGLIILPDDWSWSGDVASFEANWTPGESDWLNVYSYSEWSRMEAAGAVFLPAAGLRDGIWTDGVGSIGCYWLSSCYDSRNAYYFSFRSDRVDTIYSMNRFLGHSVRLVTEN